MIKHKSDLEGLFNDVIVDYPVLTKKEEIELGILIQSGKNTKEVQDARDKLFMSNLRLVFKAAHNNKFRTTLTYEDIVSAGFHGLIIAVDKFNPSKFKNKFSTYAYPWIKVYIDRTIDSFNSSAYVPTNILEKNNQYSKMISDNPDIPDKEIRKKLKISELTLKKVKAVNCASYFSINSELKNDSSNYNGKTYEDIIGDPDEKEPCKILSEKDDYKFKKEILYSSISELSDLQKYIVMNRHVSEEPKTLAQIASKYNLTKERIRQIEKSTITILKNKVQKKCNQLERI